MELMVERVEGWQGMEENETVYSSSKAQSMHRSSSRKSNGENLEEVVYSLWTTPLNQILTGG